MIALTQDMQIVGLIVDVLGVLMIFVAAILKIEKQIAAETLPHFDSSGKLANALAAIRIDIAAGSLFMIVGFVIQAVGSQGFVFIGEWGALSLTATILLAVIYLLVLRKIICARITRNIPRLQKAIATGQDA